METKGPRTPLERVMVDQKRNASWLARETGYGYPHCWRVMKGLVRLTPVFKLAASRALGVTPQELEG